MTGYVAKNTTLVRLADGTGYANFSDIANSTTLVFQYQALNVNSTHQTVTNWTGPLLVGFQGLLP